MNAKPHIFDLSPEELTDVISNAGMPGYRAKQVLAWVYRHGVTDPRQMTNLSKPHREALAERLTFHTLAITGHERATDGTQKLLLQVGPRSETRARQFTECVMIPAESRDSGRPRRTACISSQVGCPVGCRFCASGLGGLELNLTAGQIVEQVWQLNRMLDCRSSIVDSAAAPAGQSEIEDRKSTITNIVFMGMGEPLSNFANVTRAIRTLAADWAFNLSARRITVSTVGLPAQIKRLADQLDLPITLAISLHAPNDALRRQIIPWAQLTSIEQIIDAGRHYFEQTGREVTIEYILLREVNDRPQHARQLAQVARQLRSNVNLIRYNEVAGLPYQRPAGEDVHRFQAALKQAGVNCHIRASRGRDIAAACGQLRHEAAPAG